MERTLKRTRLVLPPAGSLASLLGSSQRSHDIVPRIGIDAGKQPDRVEADPERVDFEKVSGGRHEVCSEN
ncbi:hypothetical protein HDG33_007487 [Paraburkholderia sp. Cpub6]|nr:hypothetical protein [Paraburkholderia sp. Cpub6]MBB5463807.1 hypothetical protein [Paraburkholderia sp. Cpub6]